MIVKVRDVRNLANIHPIFAILATMAAAVLMVAQHTVSACGSGPPSLVNILRTLLPCYLSANVASEGRLGNDVNTILGVEDSYIPW